MANDEVHILIDAFQSESGQELRSFCCGFAEEGAEEEIKLISEATDEWTKSDLENAIISLTTEYIETSFAVGFLYGQEFLIVNPQARTILERIKKQLVDGGILKFTPRGKAS